MLRAPLRNKIIDKDVLAIYRLGKKITSAIIMQHVFKHVSTIKKHYFSSLTSYDVLAKRAEKYGNNGAYFKSLVLMKKKRQEYEASVANKSNFSRNFPTRSSKSIIHTTIT